VKLLSKHKVEKRLSRKLVKYYGEQVVDLLTTDCFKLLAFDRNTKALFDSCKKISENLEYPKNDYRYLQGAVDFIFNYRLDNHGHTAIGRETLYRGLLRHFNVDSTAKVAIETALSTGAVLESPDGLLQSRPVAFVEAELEHRFVHLLKANNQRTSWTSESLLGALENVVVTSIHPLTSEQRNAIKRPFISQFSILIGGAGTGKTTVISSIVQLASRLKIPVFQMALSGQAADVMRHYNILNNIKCMTRTIHSYILPLEEEKKLQQQNGYCSNRNTKFDFPEECLIIVDESSMIDLSLMSRLMRVVPDKARVIMAGDPNQIPPIGPGLVFHTLCHSARMHISKLTKPHRSAAETGIPSIADSISKGEVPTLPFFNLNQPAPEHGVYFLPTKIDKSDKYCLAKVIFQVAEKLGFENTQVITTHRKKANKFGNIPSSVHHINDYFQQKLTKGQQKELRAWGLNENDPVLIRKNVMDVGKKGFDLFNGNLGQLKSAEKPYRFKFGDNERELDDEDIARLGIQLGYALTVHSFQGSAADCIVIAITKSNLLERSLIYTALTRAKRTCVFVGDPKAFQDAVLAPPKWEKICTGFGIDRYFEDKEDEPSVEE
ncbi:MAG: exodeoxyribonuclease V alpha subunit, partial [Oleiphilaceae bacterium]